MIPNIPPLAWPAAIVTICFFALQICNIAFQALQFYLQYLAKIELGKVKVDIQGNRDAISVVNEKQDQQHQQTNGNIVKLLAASKIADTLQGEKQGVAGEQARVAEKLRLSNLPEQRLEEIRGSS